MFIKHSISAQFNCSLERAFKAPMLGDATKFMPKYRFQPAIIGFEEDHTWGDVNGIRYPISEGNFWIKKGRLAKDKILERIENESWKWTIYNFETKSLFFTSKAIGEWTVRELESGKIAITYTYSYYPKSTFFKPFTWLFVKFQIRGFMSNVMAGIKIQAESNETFFYERRGETATNT